MHMMLLYFLKGPVCKIFGEIDLLAEIEYKIILVMFTLVCFTLLVQIVVFFTRESVFYIYIETGSSTEAAIFFLQ